MLITATRAWEAIMAFSLQDYQAERDALINADRALRVDYIRPSTVLEQQADQITRRVRADEVESVWSVQQDEVPHPFPGMEFLTGLCTPPSEDPALRKSQMPKGALLHTHLDFTVGARTLLDIALRHPAIHISCPEPITSANMSSIRPDLKPIPAHSITSVASLTDPAYRPDVWVPLAAARKNFDAALGGPDGFDQWLVSKLSINPSDAYITHNNNIRIWDVFRSAGTLTRSIVYYFPIWREYIQQFLQETLEDGISYVEARINFSPKFMIGANGENVPHIDWLRIFNLVVDQFKQEHPDFFDAKVRISFSSLQDVGAEVSIDSQIIYSVIRDCDADMLRDHLEDCIRMKRAFPELIIGFDLVGDENILRPLHYYLEQLIAFKQQQQEAGVDIPFIFHAGETCGDGTRADENLYDAILLGTKRIGHGFSLVKHPKLMQICREKGIALEVCPISNEILRLTASMPMHPLPILLNHGVPVALSSDDPAMFQNMGLSFDFYQVVVASEVTGLLTLAHLARDSILHSMLREDEKGRLMTSWESHWQGFVRDLVASNGDRN
ncbi:Metallo-dependent hydrolase [Chiua virens]|nr:Metallo-dependent hydrolase [Chiua virens]